MRAHFLRAMQIESDRNLPDSHIEGTPILPSGPIRFVWDKTPKQSVHNSRMKTRFLADLKAKRRLYKHVPDKEFSKKILDSAFDQAFVTLRQKFKAQRDASIALNLKKKEALKAVKARRLSRKKSVRHSIFLLRSLANITTNRNYPIAPKRGIESKHLSTLLSTEPSKWNACHLKNLDPRTKTVPHQGPPPSIASVVSLGAVPVYETSTIPWMKATKRTKHCDLSAGLDEGSDVLGHLKMGFLCRPMVLRPG